MKLRFCFFETKAPAWVDTARGEYATKISGFESFELLKLKSPSADRDAARVKLRREAEILLSAVDEKDVLILFDEAGKTFPSSEQFSAALARVLESGKSRVVFAIGGPYGFDAEIKRRASAQWSLSALTMNHWIAQLAALEQIYRGLTLIKGIPYHNR